MEKRPLIDAKAARCAARADAAEAAKKAPAKSAPAKPKGGK